jgi:hypothetical protein
MEELEYALDLCGCAMCGDPAPGVDVHEEEAMVCITDV